MFHWGGSTPKRLWVEQTGVGGLWGRGWGMERKLRDVGKSGGQFRENMVKIYCIKFSNNLNYYDKFIINTIINCWLSFLISGTGSVPQVKNDLLITLLWLLSHVAVMYKILSWHYVSINKTLLKTLICFCFTCGVMTSENSEKTIDPFYYK